VPAAAVIPAQVAYFDVVAVKKLVVCWQPGFPAGLFPLLFGVFPRGVQGGSLAPQGIPVMPSQTGPCFPLPLRRGVAPVSGILQRDWLSMEPPSRA